MNYKNYVRADTSITPPIWWTDPLIADEIRHKVRTMHNDGKTNLGIARRLGITDRSVSRILKRGTESGICGAYSRRTDGPCRIKVRAGRCPKHRDAD